MKITGFLRFLVIAIAAVFVAEIAERIIDTATGDGDGRITAYHLNVVLTGLQVVVFTLLVFWGYGKLFKWLDQKLGSSKIKGAVTSVAGLVYLLVAAEIGLQIANFPKKDEPVVNGWRWSDTDDPRANQLGYRGQKIDYDDDDIVVLLVGDSQVQSSACGSDSLPETLLEKALQEIDPRYRVFGLGASGYGYDQELLALEKYFKDYRADHVVVWQTLANDVWNCTFPTNWPKDGVLKPTFRLEEGKLIRPERPHFDTLRYPAKSKLGALVNTMLHPQRGRDLYWEQYLPPAYQPATSYDGEFLTDWQPTEENLEKNPLLQNENFENEKAHNSLYLSPRSQRMQYSLDLAHALLEEMQEQSHNAGASFSLFYWNLPDSEAENANKITVQQIGDGYYTFSYPQLFENRDYLNRDFTTIAIPITHDDWRVSPTDGHLNCRTNNMVMQQLAKALAVNAP